MKRTFSTLAAATLLILSAVTSLHASEDWKGTIRLSGSIVDQKTGAPVKGAKLTLRIQKGGKGGPDVTADNNGRWAVLGLAAGPWNIDVEAPGYNTRQLSVAMSEGQRLPPMKIELEPAAVVQQAAPSAEQPTEEVKIGGTVVSKDIADAVEAGNTLAGEKKFKEAVVEYEKASAALPALMPLKTALARAYYGAGNLKKAIATMDVVYQSDPTNAQNALVYANMLLEDGQLEAGKSVIEKLPAGAVTDSTAIINIGIVMMNKKQPASAYEYFTRAIAMSPNGMEGYYYRALASIQMSKTKQAKPDLEKVLELAPDSPEAKDAKEYLKAIK